MPPPAATRRIQVGDAVFLSIGRNRLLGRVVEDRGNLGLRRQRILRVEIDQGTGVEPRVHEVPEAELELLR